MAIFRMAKKSKGLFYVLLTKVFIVKAIPAIPFLQLKKKNVAYAEKMSTFSFRSRRLDINTFQGQLFFS